MIGIGGALEHRNYKDPRYVKLRKAVFARDKWKCRYPNCQYKGRKLNCHHIFLWSAYPQHRYSVDRCLTLCVTHHKMVTGQEEQYISMFLQIIQGNNKGLGDNLVLKVLRKKYRADAD